MNGYLVVKGQAHSPQKQETGRDFYLSTCFLTQSLKHRVYFKNFLDFSRRHRWIPVPSDICTPPYLQFGRM